jgi:protein-S-isoprenylcysteine O-methyltransferase Ste14
VAWAALYAALGPEALGVWREPAWVRAVGWLLAGAGTLGTAIAQGQMGSSWRIGIDQGETQLVTRGLYRLVRNPIFSGCIVAAVGIALLAPSAWSIAAVFVIVVMISLQVRIEEDHLQKAHGRAYRAYAAKVGRLLPRLGRLSCPSDGADLTRQS